MAKELQLWVVDNYSTELYSSIGKVEEPNLIYLSLFKNNYKVGWNGCII